MHGLLPEEEFQGKLFARFFHIPALPVCRATSQSSTAHQPPKKSATVTCVGSTNHNSTNNTDDLLGFAPPANTANRSTNQIGRFVRPRCRNSDAMTTFPIILKKRSWKKHRKAAIAFAISQARLIFTHAREGAMPHRAVRFGSKVAHDVPVTIGGLPLPYG